ncbi:MAG: biotin transporter BioY [Lachnospiraceae bacterium]|nr:biotin transporter BioY [Lachnospiraceae bacterium]
MNQQTLSTKTLVTTAMFTAIIAVLSILEIPSPTGVPFTLQTFAIALCGFVLGQKQGTFCVFLYVLLGAVGVPIYAGMTGGLGKLLGVTGGFLFGFIPMAALCGLKKSNKILNISFALLGLIICHLLGTLQFALLMTAKNHAEFSFLHASLAVSIPYLPKDILSVIGAYFVSLALKHQLRQANLSIN